MSDPDFDVTIIQAGHLVLLREVARGVTHWRQGIPGLLTRGLVVREGLYAVRPSGRGLWALQGVMEGHGVQVSQSHKIPSWRGLVGFVEAITTHWVDADGLDGWGHVIPRARPTTTVTVRLTGQPMYQFMFRDLDDLVGLPDMLVQRDDYLKYSVE